MNTITLQKRILFFIPILLSVHTTIRPGKITKLANIFLAANIINHGWHLEKERKIRPLDKNRFLLSVGTATLVTTAEHAPRIILPLIITPAACMGLYASSMMAYKLIVERPTPQEFKAQMQKLTGKMLKELKKKIHGNR